MKKIYILTAVFALLTLSLNAQVANQAHNFKAINKAHISGMDKGQPAQSDGALRAPNRYNAADGEFVVGPYNTDDYGTTGKGLYNSSFSYPSGRVDITSILDRSEIEQYLGQEIVGFRFATTGTVSCYSFIVSIEGPNHWVNDIHVFNLQSSGSYVDMSGTGWHEYYLDEPVTFEIPDSAITVWVGYKYYQESSSSYGYTATPILVNPNSTSHETYAYSYGNEAFYDVTSHLAGDLAAQLIFKNSMPKTETPVITYQVTDNSVIITATGNGTVNLSAGGQTASGQGSASVTIPRTGDDQTITATATAQEEGMQVSNPATEDITIPALPKTPTPTITYQVVDNNMVITATGQGTVNLSVTGGYSATGEGSASVTIPLGLDEQTVTATATAQLPNYQVSDPATQQIIIPEVGRSPQPTITFTDNGDGTYTITVTGTGEVVVYIDDAEHGNEPIATADNTFSFIVEQHSQAMSITVTATNQEEGLEVSHPKTETYNIPAMTIDSGFQTLDPQPTNATTPINMSKLMFVDRFSVVIPHENNHPFLYDYYLQETQVRQRTSNSVEVPVKHTGSDGLGFYSLNQIDNDTVRTLVMDVRNAATDLPLEPDPGVYFYTAERSTAAYPDEADRKWLGVLQRTSDGTYSETLNPSYDYGTVYQPGHHIHLDTDTILGQYNDYLTYVPVVWTMGFDRVLYETDHQHNSYGAPKWKTGVGEVFLNSVDVELQTNSASVTWDDNGQTSMYIMTLDALGHMPTVNTMPYEPYMFRVFVESKNGKLRNWKWVPADSATHTGSHFEAAPGTTTGPICVWSEYVKDSVNVTFNGDYIQFKKTKVEDYDTVGHWTSPGMVNILFAALDDMDTEGEGDNERIIEDDLKIYVRFYYIVKGSADDHTPVVHGQRPRDGEGDAPAGYGSESPGTPPSPSTGVKEVTYYGDVVSTTYYNVQGMKSDKPFNGINIVVERYSNGTSRTYKVVR